MNNQDSYSLFLLIYFNTIGFKVSRKLLTSDLVTKDSRIKGFRGALPINFAIITLDEDPGLNFLSNLPGTPAGEVPVGAAVEVIFDESVEVGRQLVPEWRVIG